MVKKLLSAAGLILCGVLISAAVFAFTNIGDRLVGMKESSVQAMGIAINPSVEEEASLLDDAYTITKLLREKDFAVLSDWVHPEQGVYFIPYSTVNAQENQHFTAEEVRGFAKNKDSYVWGTVDGEGSPITMTPSEYFDRYVYDFDFAAASVIGINTVVRSGNSLENVEDAYPNAEYVELHDPGSEKYEGIDWKSLKLVFEKSNGVRKLVAIIHGEWTI